MNCSDAMLFLEAYVDNELDLARTLDLDRHLETCPDCRGRQRALTALRRGLGNPNLYRVAPPALHDRISRTLQPPSTASKSRVLLSRYRWPAVAAAVLLVALIPVLFIQRRTTPGRDEIAREVVTGHQRSLLAAHLTDVTSTDRHTVKPWFQGKLDFSPKVEDLAEQGFPLIGGRLDMIGDRPVAALVYRRGEHRINLFTWPAPDEPLDTRITFTRQGYNLVHWNREGMSFWAVSDLNAEELRHFSSLLGN